MREGWRKGGNPSFGREGGCGREWGRGPSEEGERGFAHAPSWASSLLPFLAPSLPPSTSLLPSLPLPPPSPPTLPSSSLPPPPSPPSLPSLPPLPPPPSPSLSPSRAKPGNRLSLYYKTAASLVCLCVCTPPPFFRHDQRTATKFGTHIRVDMGLILS